MSSCNLKHVAEPLGVLRFTGPSEGLFCALFALLGVRLTECEKRADEADRYVDSYLKCVYLRDRIGQTFEALITTVVDFGCFVQIPEVAADGLLHLDNLRDDEYVKDDALQAWVGLRSKRRLQLGTHVRVIVTAVNPVEGLIDLDLAPEALAGGAAGPKGAPSPGSRGRGKDRQR